MRADPALTPSLRSDADLGVTYTKYSPCNHYLHGRELKLLSSGVKKEPSLTALPSRRSLRSPRGHLVPGYDMLLPNRAFGIDVSSTMSACRKAVLMIAICHALAHDGLFT